MSTNHDDEKLDQAPASDDSAGSSRRAFLRNVGLGAAALSTISLWLPKRAKGAPPPGSVKRVILVNAPGGLRWSASFDGQADPKRNPWGLLDWKIVGAGAPPSWGFSRMLVQKPLWQNATDWAGSIYPYLTSDDAAHYNVTAPQLQTPGWNGAKLPTYADVARDIAVVRTTGNPGGQFDGDHGSASRALYTGYRSGQVGLVTAFHHALRLQMGASFDDFYDLPPVAVGQPAFSFGIGEFAGSRPIFLTGPTGLPATDPGKSVAAWGKKAEVDLDAAFAATRQAYMAQAAADFENDKSNGDAHVSQLVHPGLKLASVPAKGTPSPALGTLVDGTTPLTNDMLAEAFGLQSSQTPAGDILWDAFGAAQNTSTPTWTLSGNTFGLNAALALRLLQMGSPVVSIAVGGFDTHSYEVIDPTNRRPQTTQTVQLARSLASLVFALKNVADPKQPGKSLWDSTVVFVCSEFGRGGGNIGVNGFNSPNGQNDGGSDHDAWCGWPVFGGPVAAKGGLVTDANVANGFLHQNRILTSILKGMGVEDANNSYLPYGTFPAIPGLVVGT